jgi:thiamine-phosphate pyrophosphorylase
VRILDANANRAAEGLRVVEEYARFALEDAHLASLCKQFRHDLAEVLKSVPESERNLARETLADVGTTLSAHGEYERASLREITLANQKRVEQSLRCLEEYGKSLSAEFAGGIERLRYRAYTLARALEITADSCRRLDSVQLYVLIGGHASCEAFETHAALLVQAGVHAVQLRDKSLCDRELLSRARILRRLTRGQGTLFIMNDRPDLAALADADGVHLGQDDLTVKDARAVLGPERLVGVSTHSLDQARQAVLAGANYLGCGPTFPSGTKRFAAFPGLDFLRQVHREIRLPAFAIGGIDLEQLAAVLDTGFTRVAVSGAITNAEQPAEQVGRFLARLRERWGGLGSS